jgi:uncharacterized membrane protein (UPF0127 family)
LVCESRRRRDKISLRIVACFILAFAGPPVIAAGADSELIVVRRDGVTVRLEIERADGPRARQAGLMWRDHLAPRSGMLFDFERSQHIQMWMKNTLIPLDMLFVTERGELVYVERNASPRSLRLIASPRAVRYVLEINGGESVDLGFAPGDRFLLTPRSRTKHTP